MRQFEKDVITPLIDEGRVLKWIRYIDDTYLVYTDPQVAVDIAARAKEWSPNLRLTTELPTDDVVPFLDLDVHMGRGQVTFSIHTKDGIPPIYTHWSSDVPTGHRVAAVRALVNRTLVLPITPKAREAEAIRIAGLAKQSAMPKATWDRTVTQCIHRQCLVRFTTALTPVNREGPKSKSIVIPWMHGHAPRLMRELTIPENVMVRYTGGRQVADIAPGPKDPNLRVKEPNDPSNTRH